MSEIIGFDFGHGETAVCRLDSNSRMELMPDPLRLGDSQSKAGPILTAVAEASAGDGSGVRILIGQDAVTSPAASDVHVAFKSADMVSDNTRRPLQLFIARVLRHLIDERIIVDPESTRYIFGAPTGWNSVAYKEFERVLSEIVPSPVVQVVPESRAAFAYAAHAEEIDFSTDQARRSMLLVDLGSSTIDITAVDAMASSPIDIGEPLGASLLELEILRAMLDHPANAPLKDLVLTDPTQLARCEAECRKAKEDYYDAVGANGTLLAPITRPKPMPGGGYFVVELDQEIMRGIEETGLEQLGGAAWFERLQEVLENARTIVNSRDSAPEIVLLTGGAARMPRVLDVAMSVFGNDIVRRGTEPGLAIARGLALLGNIDQRVSAFQSDVDRFVRDVLPDLVKSHAQDFAEKVAEAITEGLTEKLVLDEIQKWIDNEHKTLRDASKAIEGRLVDWLKSTECQGRLRSAAVDWFNDVSADLRTKTDPICEQHGMPRGSLSLPEFAFEDEVRMAGVPLNVLDTEAVENLLLGVSALVGTAVATIAFGSGVAIVAPTGIGAVIVATIVIFAGVFIGMDAAKEEAQAWVETANIWPSARRLLGDSLRSKLRSNSEQIEAEIAEALIEALTSGSDAATGRAELVSDTIKAVDEHLRGVASRAAILIT